MDDAEQTFQNIRNFVERRQILGRLTPLDRTEYELDSLLEGNPLAFEKEWPSFGLALTPGISTQEDLGKVADSYAQVLAKLKESSKLGEKGHPHDDVEIKVLGQTLGRRGRSAVRRLLRKPEFDGDGDGFITNPRTGRDDFPAPKRFKPQVSTQRARAKLQGSQGTGSSASSSDEALARTSLINVMKSLDGDPDIKELDWRTARKRIKEIEDFIEQKHGRLETVSDYQRALQAYIPDVTFDGDWSPNLGRESQGFLNGVLYSIASQPSKYIHSEFLVLVRDGGQLSSGASPTHQIVARGQSTYDRSIGGLIVDFGPAKLIDAASGARAQLPQGTLLIGVNHRIQKGHVRELVDQVESGQRTAADALEELDYVDALGTGLHEGAHTLHFMTAIQDSVDYRNLDSSIIQRRIDQIKRDNKPELIEFLELKTGVEVAHNVLTIIQVLARGGIDEAKQYWQDIYDRAAAVNDNEAMERVQDEMDAIDAAFQDTANLFNALVRNTVNDDPELERFKDLLSQLMTEGNARSGVDELAFTEPDLLRRIVDLYARLEYNLSRDQIMEQGWSAVQDDLATNFLIVGKMMDDLTKSEVTEVRKVWAKVSEYARDRFSYYGGRNMMASMEGIAEAWSMLRMFGSPAGLTPTEKAAFDKLMSWLDS